MLDPGIRVMMTKGYRGIEGVVLEAVESRFEFYVVRLDNGIHVVVGPSSFESLSK